MLTPMRMADRNCGMNAQAVVLLAALSEREVDLPKDAAGNPIYGYVSTRPYCNCREMGFCLQVRIGRLKPLNLVFYEHRNSDELCCLRWEGDTNINGSVTPDDIPTEVFPNKWTFTKSWPYMSIREAADYAREEIEAYAEKAVAASAKLKNEAVVSKE